MLHAAVLLQWPVAPVIAAGIWWNSNTISHNFIHRPFFTSRPINRAFSAALSVLLGIPQTLWRDRHLAHHAGVAWRWRTRPSLITEILLVAASWTMLAWHAPQFFLRVYVPGYLAGLTLCAAQGCWEHAGSAPISHYGRLYNFLCFNDGYHAEHHAMPGVHWSDLSSRQSGDAVISSFPALLRWIEGLERMILRFPALQRFMLRTHRRAIAKLLPHIEGVRRITIVGGGLFPRTALICRALAPGARLTIVDSAARHLEIARG